MVRWEIVAEKNNVFQQHTVENDQRPVLYMHFLHPKLQKIFLFLQKSFHSFQHGCMRLNLLW